jgi:hypothetical protein
MPDALAAQIELSLTEDSPLEPLLPHLGETPPRRRHRFTTTKPGLHLRSLQPRVTQAAVDAPPANATVAVGPFDLIPARGRVPVNAALDTNAPYGLRVRLHRELVLLVPRPRALARRGATLTLTGSIYLARVGPCRERGTLQ